MTRKILIAVAMGGVWAAYGCGSSGSGTATNGGRGQLNTGPIADLITPPADPNAPPADPNAPSSGVTAPADPNAPPSDPNAPPGGPSGKGPSCSQLCAGIDQACAEQCASLCTVIDTPAATAGTCNGALVAARACISTAGLVCTKGKVRVPGDQCNEEDQALLSCGSTTVTIHPGSGGEANGSGGQNNGNGAQNNGGGHPPCAQQCATLDSSCSQNCAQYCAMLDTAPPSCSDAASTLRTCIMNAGLTCTQGSTQPANGACGQESSALSGCAQPPMGAGGTGP